MPIHVRAMERQEIYGGQQGHVDISNGNTGSGAAEVRTLAMLASQQIIRVGVAFPVTNAAVKTATLRVRDSSLGLVPIMKRGDVMNAQQSCVEFTGTWNDADSYSVTLDTGSLEVFKAAVEAADINDAGTSFAAGEKLGATTTAGSTTFTSTGSQDAEGMIDGLVAAFNSDTTQTSAGFAAVRGGRLGTNIAVLCIYKTDGTSLGTASVTQGGGPTWGGSRAIASETATATEFASVLAAQVNASANYSATQPLVALEFVQITRAVNNKSFQITPTVTTAGSGDIDVEKVALAVNDMSNGVEAGDIYIVEPTVSNSSSQLRPMASESFQIEVEAHGASLSGALPCQASYLSVARLDSNNQPEDGPHFFHQVDRFSPQGS